MIVQDSGVNAEDKGGVGTVSVFGKLRWDNSTQAALKTRHRGFLLLSSSFPKYSNKNKKLVYKTII